MTRYFLLEAFLKSWKTELCSSNPETRENAYAELVYAKQNYGSIDLLQAIQLISGLEPLKVLAALEQAADSQDVIKAKRKKKRS